MSGLGQAELGQQLALFADHDAGRKDIHSAPSGGPVLVRAAGESDRRDVFNAELLPGLKLVTPHDIPLVGSCQLVPEALIAFSEAMRPTAARLNAWVHFYEDDYRFVRLWRHPRKYTSRLRMFAGVIGPDFSVYRNMPQAQKVESTFRNQLLAARMQADGIPVIPNVRLSGRSSIPYALAGTPTNSTIAIGLHGCTRDRENRDHVRDDIQIICSELEPTALVVYGGAGYGLLDHPRGLGIPVHIFTPDTFARSNGRGSIA